MKRCLLSLLLTVGAAAQPPQTPTVQQVDRYHGVSVQDPYRWLEDASSPRVKAWIEAQNKHTERVLASYPEGEEITQRVGSLALSGVRKFSPVLAGQQLFFMRDTPPQAQPVLVGQRWPDGPEQVLVDTNTGSGSEAILEFWPSPSGHYVAFGTAQAGTENTQIQVVDTRTGKRLPDVLVRAGGGTTPASLAWDGDEAGFSYVHLPHADTEFHAQVLHHSLGDPQSEDRLEFGRELSPIVEYSLSSSADGRHAGAVVHFGDGSPGQVFLRMADGKWQRVLGPEGIVRSDGAWLGSRFLVVSHQGSSSGKVLAIDPDGQSSMLIPADSWTTVGVAPVSGGLLVERVSGPDWRVDQFDESGHFVRRVPLPEQGLSIGTIASSETSDFALLSYDGWTVPNRWDRYDCRHRTLQTVFAGKPAADYSQVRSTRIWAQSQDGTRVPVTVLALESTPKDGKRPTILTAYGGFGVNTAPHFIGPNLAWLERGGVWAVANLRGGREFGEDWHRNGMLTRKQNVFNDFFAASQALIQSGWTSREHLGITGGSNGGLLMGASLTQHPEQYRAAAAFVGLYDMLRSELWPNGRYNTAEFGSVQDPEQFAALHAYSPLHHVQPGTSYPATLLETGENDARVAPWQSRKFAAALQAAQGGTEPILLLTQMNAGHGQGATFSQRVGKTALMLTFFAHQLK